MVLTSTSFVRASILAGILAISSTAAAQPANDAAGDDVGDVGVSTSSTVLAAYDGLPETSLPAIPIRDWQLGGVLTAPQVSWQMGRSLGAPPRIPRLPQPTRSTPRSPAYKGAQRVLAGVAMGTIGSVIGTAAGALMGSVGCGCEDGALPGMMIGAPVGAAGGALLGLMMTR